MKRAALLIFLFFAVASAQEPVPAPVEGKGNLTASGTRYWDLKIGTGKKAIPGFTLKVNYIGWFKKSKTTYVIFDSTLDKPPMQFDLGLRKVIKGWDEGLVGMRVGGKRQLQIPADSAYGARGLGTIPPNMPLIFEVELLDVR